MDDSKIKDRRWSITPLDDDMPTPEEIETAKQRIREQRAMWVWEWDTYYDNEQLMREIIEQAKEEVFFAWGL